MKSRLSLPKKELTTRARFQREADGGRAEGALQTFIEGDTDFASVVEKKLLTLLQQDPLFAQELSHLLQSGPQQLLKAAEEAQATRIRMNNTQGSGRQEIDLVARAKADDVQFHIGSHTCSNQQT